jgi:hypothetical protein
MEYKELKNRIEEATKDMTIVELEDFRRAVSFHVSTKRNIWKDIEKERRQSFGYFTFEETIDWKDADQRKILSDKEKSAIESVTEYAKRNIREFTEACCQGLLEGGKARWWWSMSDDPEHKNKPTEISDEAKELASLMVSHSFWYPHKGRCTDYVDVRDYVASVLHSCEYAEDIFLRDTKDISDGVTSAAAYDEFLRFYRTRESVEKDYMDGLHCGDCTSQPCSCCRCILDDTRKNAEELMLSLGWIG